jgi:hypothetical protein
MSTNRPAFPPEVMERQHAELAIVYLGALTGMAGSMIDLLRSAGVEDDQAQDEAGRMVRRSLDEARDLLTTLTGRAFDHIVEEFLRGASAPAADGKCRAAELLERVVRAA